MVLNCRKVRALGHGIYGTIRMDRGVLQHLKEHMTSKMKEKGDCACVQSPQDDLTISAWHDSKVAVCNIHPPSVVMTKRRMKGRADR
eukprot:1543361-Rhodomonas_salina.1